jgi:hypothetical protein
MTTAGHGEDEHTQKMHRARPSPKQLASRHVPAARTSRPDQMLDLSGNVMHGGSHVWRSINRGTETDQQPTTIHQRPVSATMIDGIILPLLIGMAAACKGKSPENHPTKGKGLAPALPPVCHAWHQSRVVVSSPSRSRAGLGAAAASGAVFLPARSDLRRARPRSAPAREVGVARHDDREKERELLSGSGALTLAGPAESLANARCLSVWAPAEWNSNCRRLLAAGATVRRWQGKDQGTPRLLRALGGPEGQGWRWCSTRRSRRRRCCEVRTHQHAR